MDDVERRGYEASAQQIRADLKRFESEWAANNGGSKPGREDIKANPEIGEDQQRLQPRRLSGRLTTPIIIANLYKKYNKVRDILAGKVAPPKRSSRSREEQPAIQTPSKRARHAETPSKSRTIQVDDQTFATPSTRKLFSPVAPTSIGPTPQKDGRILGLFDMLSGGETPSKPSAEQNASKPPTIDATPTKRKASDMEQEDEAMKFGRMPMSSSKRAMLDTFLTPLKKKDPNVGTKTPQTVRKLEFNTPAFLRRTTSLPALDENDEYDAPQPLRLPKKPYMRGLSSVVASLRKMEEDHLDDDLEALREMEAGDDAAPPMNKPAASSAPASAPAPESRAEILEPDSQGHQLLGGFDDEALYDSEAETQVGRDGLPLKIYQKKGQKRTTRRVNMRPTRSKRPTTMPGAQLPAVDEDEDVVAETQINSTTLGDGSDPLDLSSDSEFGGESGDESATERTASARKKKQAAANAKSSAKATKESTVTQAVKKVGKKISATAHQNFQRLKLKNYGAKGGPGFNSRFRRRR